MACQSVYTWSFTGLVTAFLDLYIAFFLLCASAAAFWASKFLGVLGLSLPCPCEGFFGFYFNKNLCFKKLFIEYPLEKISYVQLSVMSRFPFNDIVLIRHPNCDLNLRSIRDEERKVIELDGDGASCSEVSITRKPSNNFSFNEELGAKNEVSQGAVKELGTNKERFDIKGKGILHHRQPSTGFRRRRKSGFYLAKYPSVGSYDSVLSSVQEYPRFPCSIGLTDVRNDDVCTEKDVNGKLVYDNCDKNTIKRLEKALEEQHASYCALYLELEKERSASASATEEAMAMIQRLQEEKASIEIEARQYQRILEEKSAYDAEEMSILEEILIHRERENHFLEKELESYREIMSSVGPKLSDFSIDSNDASMEKKEDINNTTGSEKEHDNVITEPHGVLDPSLSEEEEPYTLGSILSFSPWILTVASSLTDRIYNNSIQLGNGQKFVGIGLTPPTYGQGFFPLAAAADVGQRNTTAGLLMVESCQTPEQFIRALVHSKIVICTYTFDFESGAASIAAVADTIYTIGAAGFIMTMNPDIGTDQIKGATLTLHMPGVILSTIESSSALWKYYNSNTIRSRTGRAIGFGARGKILDGRIAMYTKHAPMVAVYSSRGPDVNNALLETADVLKPNILAPGSSIWAAWSPNSEGDEHIKGQNFALLSGTSMATPHIAGIAALIKQKHPDWNPSMIASAIMTTANVTDLTGSPILAQQNNQHSPPATPFDYGSGAVNPTRAIDPGLVFNISFKHYVQFLCSVPGVDDMSVSRAVGVSCPTSKKWCSDLNTPSVTVANLVGKRKVLRRVTNVGDVTEKYRVEVNEPLGVRVTVKPNIFKIRVNASRHVSVYLNASQTTNAFTFGDIVFHGDKSHIVRVPLAVYVASSIG